MNGDDQRGGIPTSGAGGFPPFAKTGDMGGIVSPADVIGDDPVKFLRKFVPSCKRAPDAGRGDNEYWVFGGADNCLTMRRAEVRRVLNKIEHRFKGEEGRSIPREQFLAMRQDEALMDFALMAALNARPYRHNHNGAVRNIYYADGGRYRVRKIRKTGDCWIDYRQEGAADWDFRHFKNNAFSVVCSLHPLLRGLRADDPGDFKRIILWFSLIAKAVGRRPAIRGNAGRRLHGRTAFFGAIARHPGMRVQTRVMFGAMSVAAKGVSPRDFRDAVQKAMSAAGLGGEHGRVAQRTLGAVRGEIYDWIHAGGFRWRNFLSWKEQVIIRLTGAGRAAEFRGLWKAWEFCLSRERGSWRWEGWHLIPGRGLRRDAGAARRLANATRTSKQTAERTLRTGEFIGFFERSGISICLSPGLWGAALRRKMKAARVAKTQGWLLPMIERCLSPPSLQSP